MFLKLLAAASPESRFFKRQAVLLTAEVLFNEKFKELRESKAYQSALTRFEKQHRDENKHREAAVAIIELIREFVKNKEIKEV